MNSSVFYFILLLFIVHRSFALIVISSSEEVFSHTQARFGRQYENTSIVGYLEESEPFDACTPLKNNHTGSIVLAIRGGPRRCSFDTKVANVSAVPLATRGRLNHQELLPPLLWTPSHPPLRMTNWLRWVRNLIGMWVYCIVLMCSFLFRVSLSRTPPELCFNPICIKTARHRNCWL